MMVSNDIPPDGAADVELLGDDAEPGDPVRGRAQDRLLG